MAKLRVALGVPVMHNFKGYTQLMATVDREVYPIVYNNWDKNDGVAAAWNEMLMMARYLDMDALAIVNDDVLLAPDTLDKLVESVQDLDLVSAASGPEDEPGLRMDDSDFACFVVKPNDFIEKHGYFDEKYKLGYFEDNDMSYRIRLNGNLQAVRRDARMFHAGSQTQFWNGGRVVSHEQFRRNQARYEGKWGGMPRHEVYDTPFDSGADLKDW